MLPERRSDLIPRDLPTSWTRREILQQPATLRATQALLRGERDRIHAFIAPLLARRDLRIVLTGAGTSAFIGECLAPWLSETLGRPVEAIATTDIVSAPHLHLRRDAPTLLVSFGRSGSSPESVAAVRLADTEVAEAYHLIVTCNADGELAQNAGARTHIIVLPEETHDRGFAMTSSFSAMLLAALSILGGIDRLDPRVDQLASAVEEMLVSAEPLMAELAGRRFDRAVYLGSGVFKGLAREAALKLLELTDGAIVAAFDTPLGFRHGPKTIVTEQTVIVVFVSNDPLTRRYDLDIVAELRRDDRCGALIVVSAQDGDNAHIVARDMAGAPDVDLLFPFIVPAQLLSLHASLALNITPDQPSATGTVNRVVQGVRIHAVGA